MIPVFLKRLSGWPRTNLAAGREAVVARPPVASVVSRSPSPLASSAFKGSGLIENRLQIGPNRELELLEVHAAKAAADSAVLFVHGSWSKAQMFVPGMKELAEMEFNSFAFSQTGHGSSSGSEKARTNYSLEDYHKNLCLVIEEIKKSGIKNLHIVGHSLGGCLLLKYLRKHDPVVKSATLIAAGDFLAANLRFSFKFPGSLLRSYRSLNATEAVSDPEVCARLLFSCSAAELPKEFLPDKASLLANVQACFANFNLRGSPVPIQVLAGEDDQVFPVREMRVVASRLNTSLTVLPGPHMGIISHRQAYLNKIAEFFSNNSK